jgi:phage-related protein
MFDFMSCMTYAPYMKPIEKPLVWVESETKTHLLSRSDRHHAGVLLRKLQHGENIAMPHSRPMPSIGHRCHELRINGDAGDWRIICRIDEDAIVILDVFLKKTRRTPKRVIDASKARLREYEATYRGRLP